MKLGKETRIALAAVVMIALLAVVYLLLPKGGGEDSVAAPVVVSQAEYDRGIAERGAVLDGLLDSRAELMAKMKLIATAKNNKKDALLADPEWCALKARLEQLNADYEAVRVDLVDFRETHVVADADNATIEEGISK